MWLSANLSELQVTGHVDWVVTQLPPITGSWGASSHRPRNAPRKMKLARAKPVVPAKQKAKDPKVTEQVKKPQVDQSWLIC